jgi:aminoglycoside phosphotransferase family enzyme/predicted kinase
VTAFESELVGWLSGQADRTIETACARVFLLPDRALKVKRHADLGYADFTTPEKRLWALDRELAFNKAAAPDIYRAVRRVTREAGGGLAIDGAGETVEYLLEMRRFDDAGVLGSRPELVDGALAEQLGRAIAGLHAEAPLRPQGGVSSMDFTVGSNAQLLTELIPELGRAGVEELIELTNAELARQRPLLTERTAAGYARRCHGDLHLGNILLEDGRPILFDCIEFNDLLSDIDVQYDVAFLLMDLDFRGRRDAAVRVLSAYLDQAARSFSDPLLIEGLAAMPLMLSVRAGVRAHVSAHSHDPELAKAYVAAGIAHLSPPPPVLLAVGGLSGSGKSVFSRAIAPLVGPSPGAAILRTDEVRKRLAGAGPTEPLPPSAYEPEQLIAAYDAMFSEAEAMLKAGRAVALDATFMAPGLRARAEELARRAGVPFHGVWMDAPAEVLETRVGARSGDASDATVEVLRQQLARDLGAMTWTRVDATRPTASSAADWRAGLRD